MVFHKNAFLIYHGQIGGRDKIPDMFIQMIVIPFTLAGLINMFMDQVVPHSQQMDGIFLLLLLKLLLLHLPLLLRRLLPGRLRSPAALDRSRHAGRYPHGQNRCRASRK